jgi:hypothetical protein
MPKQIPPLRCGMTTKDARPKPFGDDKKDADADPPFDFAQGRLFGDANKKSERNSGAIAEKLLGFWFGEVAGSP